MSVTNNPYGASNISPFAGPGHNKRTRVGGSGFTVFVWENQPIAFARQVAHTSPAPVGPGAVPIQPLDARHPVQIITPEATSMGQMTVELYELYEKKVWEALAHLAGSEDLVDIFHRLANLDQSVTMHKRIFPPGKQKTYSEVYHNCVITNVLDGETIEVGTMEVLKQVTVAYTHMTPSGHKGQ